MSSRLKCLFAAFRAAIPRCARRKAPPKYPPSFLWGAAFSAHQTEGVEGGGEHGDWYRLEHETKDGKPTILGGDTADRATDFWDRYAEDFREASAIGLTTLRTSIAWEKVSPAPGVFRADVLDHYRTILESMRANGLRPMTALHHFTHPTWFHERGGWTSSEAPDLFLEYATRVVEALGDLCDLWITFNEPMILVELGYLKGLFPPQRASLADAYEAAYQLARAHRRVAAMIRAKQGLSRGARGPDGALRGVGLAQAVAAYDPSNPKSPEDRAAAEALADLASWDFVRGITGERLRFTIPAEVPGAWSFDRAFPADEPPALDWLGVNYYTRWLLRFAPESDLRVEWVTPPGERGDNGWAIAPEGLARVLAGAAARFPGVPLVVTENGLADTRDDRRPSFLRAHLASLDRALSTIDLRGYYHWSLTDNFEWLDGYRMRFGLVEIRYDRDLARVPRPSARTYANLLRARSAHRGMRAKIPFPDPHHDGFVLALWDVDLPPDELSAIFARMTAAGARHVAVPVFGCQSDPASSDVGSCEVASYARALDLARAVRDHGLSVGFLPIVADARWDWRGEFEPADRAAWFARYGRWIVGLARDARRLGASDLVVGTEFTKIYRHAEGWRSLLAEVRTEFPGPLVVTVNWSDLDLDFWEDADALGVSAYHPIAAHPSASQDELDAGWRDVRDEILRVARARDLPVHISEIGYPAMAHAAQRPWDGTTDSPADPDLQARCFEAFRRAWRTVGDLVRVDVWAAGDPRREDDRGFGVFGKPAEAVIRQMFAERAGW